MFFPFITFNVVPFTDEWKHFLRFQTHSFKHGSIVFILGHGTLDCPPLQIVSIRETRLKKRRQCFSESWLHTRGSAPGVALYENGEVSNSDAH